MNGSRLEVCGPQTGHTVKPIAFCHDAETAERLADALIALARLTDHNLRPTDMPDCLSCALNALYEPRNATQTH